MPSHQLPADEEEERAEGEARGGRRRRPRPAAIAPGHRGIGADQPQRGQPPVALLAAEADRGGGEDADRQQQHREGDQRSSRISTGSMSSALRVAEVRRCAVPAKLFALPGWSAPSVVGEYSFGPESPSSAMVPTILSAETFAQQRSVLAPAARRSAGETTISPGRGQRVEPRRYGRVSPPRAAAAGPGRRCRGRVVPRSEISSVFAAGSSCRGNGTSSSARRVGACRAAVDASAGSRRRRSSTATPRPTPTAVSVVRSQAVAAAGEDAAGHRGARSRDPAASTAGPPAWLSRVRPSRTTISRSEYAATRGLVGDQDDGGAAARGRRR